MAKRQYKRPHFYSIGSMITYEDVHQVWEIVGNALDRNGFKDADGELSIRVYDETCLLYTSPSPRDRTRSRMPSSA